MPHNNRFSRVELEVAWCQNFIVLLPMSGLTIKWIDTLELD